MYSTANASAYKNAAADGRDIGVDLAQLDSALQARISCSPVVAVHAARALASLRIQPNPFRGQTTLFCGTELDRAVLVLYNLMGEELRRIVDLREERVDLDLEDLRPGVYFIVLFQDGKTIARGSLVVK